MADTAAAKVDTTAATAAAATVATDTTKGAAATLAAGDTTKTAATTAAATTDATKTAAVIDPAAAATAANDWKVPDTWRENLAKGNEKLLGELKRFTTFDKYVESTWNLRQRLSAGEFRRPLGENPTEDEIKQYRADNGIPEKAEDYKLPDGLKIGEEDQPIIDEFLKFSHDKHRSQAEVQEVVDWYFKAQEQAREQMYEQDLVVKQQSEDALRASWGQEFRGNVNAIQGWIKASAPKGLFERLMGGRLADGSVIGNDVEMLLWLAQTARELNPAAAVVPGGAGATIDTVNGRIEAIDKMMRNDPPGSRDAYFKDEKLQKEYRDLISARDAMKGGKAA